MKILLKSLKRLHVAVNPDASAFGRNWRLFPNKEYASKLIHDALLSSAPLMVARLGATELTCMVNYLGVKQAGVYKNARRYIANQTPPWWWNESTIDQMQKWSGFFPARVDKIERFCEMMIADLPKVDILGSWLKEERFFAQDLQDAKKVMLEDLEPFFASQPWTWALEGKRVLVVHPFATTIENQYVRRRQLFDNNLLPQFDLRVIPAVQSIAGQKTGFTDWFAALDSMKEEIGKHKFDVCILGCGAYGFPLAAFVKGMGKKAIHLGGVTQLLFGIKGSRWEQYLVYPYANLFNDAWVRPSANETPARASTVESACYW
jgi:hypothetical protein